MASGGRSALRCAISRNTSLPVSAHECAASASIDAAPVTTAATDLASAMSRFAPSATITVVSDSPPARDSRATSCVMPSE